MRLRGLLLAAALVGIACAIVLAVALRDTRGGAATAASDPIARGAPAGPGAPATPAPPQVAPARGKLRWERVVDAGKIAARVADPDGGPDWAVRRYGARERLVPRDGNGPRAGRAMACAQLGRIVGGRFGWIDGANVFRPVAPGREGSPGNCTMLRRAGRVVHPPVERLLRVSDPATGEAQPLQSVTWGMADAAGDRIVLRVRGSADRAVIGPGVEYRVPDPSGGLPWGVPATSRPGVPACLAWLGRVVGASVGRIDHRLGTLTAATNPDGSNCATSPRSAPSLGSHRPIAVLTSSSSGQDVDPDTRVRRVARRTLQGVTTIVGIAHPDVVTVTLETPRDIRTLAPSPRDHVFAAVYDGDFPTGGIVVVARLRDGSERRVSVGPFRW